MADDEFRLDAPTRRDLMQAIPSHYYNITDPDGRAVGGLLVFLDRSDTPVRGEIHLHDELPDDVAAAAVRQAYHIIGDRYFGDRPLPVQVRESFALGETLRVSLGDPATAPDEPRRWPILPILGGLLALLLVFGIGWATLTWLRGRGATSTTEVPVNSEPGESPAPVDPGPAIVLPTPALSTQLPTSRMANPNIKIGEQVRISPGFTLTLRSEAGADAGEIVGFLANGEQAEVLDGPIQTRGNTDTIVWWYVRLVDGTEAWAAANTSEVTLLELVQ